MLLHTDYYVFEEGRCCTQFCSEQTPVSSPYSHHRVVSTMEKVTGTVYTYSRAPHDRRRQGDLGVTTERLTDSECVEYSLPSPTFSFYYLYSLLTRKAYTDANTDQATARPGLLPIPSIRPTHPPLSASQNDIADV
jgi:hypothetical protein